VPVRRLVLAQQVQDCGYITQRTNAQLLYHYYFIIVLTLHLKNNLRRHSIPFTLNKFHTGPGALSMPEVWHARTETGQWREIEISFKEPRSTAVTFRSNVTGASADQIGGPAS